MTAAGTHRRPIDNRICIWRAALVAFAMLTGLGAGPSATANEEGFASAASIFFQNYCFDCHGEFGAEAEVDLERMSGEPSRATSFKDWQRVVAMLDAGKMPPEDMPQPSQEERQQIGDLLRADLASVSAQLAGDPGEVVMRRLTSAEYGYTIRDLTGLDLGVERDFVDDAVGGEGFANVGTVQFIQDSSLQRYLDAAHQVAAHAVIGGGPLRFYRDPGETGRELWAIHRIQEIYRRHGFRTAAGEGGEPFGLDRYPQAFYLAWQYRYRDALGLGDESLAELAEKRGISSRFAEHIWSVMNAPALTFPTSEIASRWKALPSPDKTRDPLAECEQLYDALRSWQSLLAESAGNDEEASVLSEKSLQASASRPLEARLTWPEDATTARFTVAVLPAGGDDRARGIVLWRGAQVRFRLRNRRWTDPVPLSSLVSADAASELKFGSRPDGGAIPSDAFATAGPAEHVLELPIPENARFAELTVTAELDIEHGDDCVVRCVIARDGEASGRRSVSAILADPRGAAFQSWKGGVLVFARVLPEISHREPAPSDRDPIPPPFENTYNTDERNHFHYKIKYHRDDRFLVEHILDGETRQRLDEAWTDLLTSFEYHDAYLRFVADKFDLELDATGIAGIDDAWIERLPPEPQGHVRRLRDEYVSMHSDLRAAQPGHVEDVLALAARAWRRSLAGDEQDRLRTFYHHLRTEMQLDHPHAVRTVLARVLTAPDFLYRVERPSARPEPAPLSDWELAARLSYFLWSSLPDEELSRAAAVGELGSPDALARQARRMLVDPKGRRLATEFFGQWFGFYQFDRYRGIDPERFPEFTDELRSSLYDEAVSFFEHIVREDRPVDEILFADYAFVNRDLAEHYSLELPTVGEELTRVEGLTAANRGGLLGLGAVLTVTSAPLRTSPVKRGDWILRRVLGTPVPPPPPDAGSIPADDVLADGRTVRERLEAHRRDPSCVNCHSRMDPLGFALEHYDPLGRWRSTYRDGQAIDPSGRLNDGTEVSGPEGLEGYLKEQRTLFHRTLCTKLVGYALGRTASASDEALVERMMREIADGEGSFSGLVELVVTSRQFRYHRGRAESPSASSTQSEEPGP